MTTLNSPYTPSMSWKCTQSRIAAAGFSCRVRTRSMPGRQHAIPLSAMFELPPIPARPPLPDFNRPMPPLPPIPALPEGQDPRLPGVDPRIQIRDIHRIVRRDGSADGLRYLLPAARLH
ncbi:MULTISPECIES: hypothetical protein [unclassified Bordetella]|uniref:hypothetical protein n=1 Tax=unclassified Bordetella TaxID=2630031 RepID=UPI00132B036C|nr:MULTISPECIES: hypothetical protein [unclassified Bordetella]MVW72019.1 hypothetical protein [Bordetella sp. 15P40C-2]MVW78734.1 hypothetical protein [Bordetella sp. 02P26C-1]